MNKKMDNEGNVHGYLIFIAVVFLILMGRLFQVQVINGSDYQTQSSNNTLRLIDIPAKRGDITARNNEPLAVSRPMASVAIDVNASKEDYEKTIYNLSELLKPLGYDEEKIRKKIEDKGATGAYGVIEIVKVPYDQGEGMQIISKIYERAAILPAAEVQIIPTRYYPQESVLGVTLGYVGAISKEEYEKDKGIYKQTDSVGKMGLEKALEQFKKEGTDLRGLYGIKGTQEVEVDMEGKTIKTKGEINPSQTGDDFQLTIDLRLQKALENALDEQIKISQGSNPKAGSGSAILMDVKTGEILAMASKPYFDPNDFVNGLSEDKADYYIRSLQTPMVNKVLNTPYPPGSTFKMTTAIAGLTYGNLTPNSQFTCTGKFWEPPYIPCTGVHGTIGLETGLKVSCNVYFQAVSQQTGIDNISKTARQLGLGVDTGFTDMAGVSKGFLPTPDSKAAYEKEYLEGFKEMENSSAADKIVAINQNSNLSESEKRKQIEAVEAEKDETISAATSNYEWAKSWYPYDTYNLSIGQGMNNYTVLQLGQYVSTIANGGTRYKPTLVKKAITGAGEVAYESQPTVLNKLEVSQSDLAAVKAGMHLVTKSGGTAGSVFNDYSIPVAGKTGTAETGRATDNAKTDYHGVFVGFAPYDDPQIAIAVVVEYGKDSSTSAAWVAKGAFDAYFNK